MPETLVAHLRLRQRVLVDAVAPQIDGGRHPVKRVLSDRVTVSCDLICDGHDLLAGELQLDAPSIGVSERMPLARQEDDRYAATFVASEVGVWAFAIEAWVDEVATWRLTTQKRLEAGQELDLALREGARLLGDIATRASGVARGDLEEAVRQLLSPSLSPSQRFAAASTLGVITAADIHADRSSATRSRVFRVAVDPALARFSAWYEMFPRSAGAPGSHGTLRDCIARLPYVAAMGFDVLYLPPIHPIGRAFRKGRDNATRADPGEPGSPWAIGAVEGGHLAVHPDLGTLDDLRALAVEARRHGIELALDIALQASQDHPYVTQHPAWFKHRADGSIQCAENPPKKYEDVVPFDFAGDDAEGLWRALIEIFHFWYEQGVHVFRVDNPHTKPLPFWERCLSEVKAAHPEAIFLAEAFTRPKLMYALAKCGFSQSYTYFAWRHSRAELTAYIKELTTPPVSEFFRPNFWPNTPDILTEDLQFGGRAAFIQRLLLAATLSSNYGIYGPPFELMEHAARPGTEEYASSEKYEVRTWDREQASSLRDVVALVNATRRAHPALQDNRVTLHDTDNDQLLAFSKRSGDGRSVVLVVINLDYHHAQTGHVALDLPALGVGADETFQVHDALTDERYRWRGPRAHVQIDPGVMPGSIFVVRRKVRSELDFDYFL